jgi:hypothetical protein
MRGYPAPNAAPETIRWIEAERLCRRYGWTLEYALSLNVKHIMRLRALAAAEKEVADIEREQAKMRRANRPRKRR